MSNDFYFQSDFKKAVNEKIQQLSQKVSDGKVESFERYKELTGQIAGLKKALDISNDVAKRRGELEESE
ncbi:MAG: hypothetical protein ACRBBW_13135 [Cellvibrionaceae bacterium]